MTDSMIEEVSHNVVLVGLPVLPNPETTEFMDFVRGFYHNVILPDKIKKRKESILQLLEVLKNDVINNKYESSADSFVQLKTDIQFWYEKAAFCERNEKLIKKIFTVLVEFYHKNPDMFLGKNNEN